MKFLVILIMKINYYKNMEKLMVKFNKKSIFKLKKF